MRTGHVMQGSKKLRGVAALARPLHVGFDGRKVRNRRGWRGSIGVATSVFSTRYCTYLIRQIFVERACADAACRCPSGFLASTGFGVGKHTFDCSSVPSFAFSNARWCNELKKTNNFVQ
jgi:hypothetical protein